MKKPGLETYLYSAIGVIAMLVLLVVINVIGAQAKQRIDLTSDRAYTLSAGTRAILTKIDTPVQIRFFAGDRAHDQSPKTSRRRDERASGGRADDAAPNDAAAAKRAAMGALQRTETRFRCANGRAHGRQNSR